MPTNVIMPQLGESVVEGTVSRWLKQVGDRIEAFEPLLEVSTDKVDTEVPAPAGGVLLRILIPEGSTVERGTVLALIGDEQAQPQAAPASLLEESRSQVSLGSSLELSRNGAAAADGYTGHITPVVARMAAEHHLDLARITGTGRDGRITKKDVEAYLEQRQQPAGAPASAPAKAIDPWDQPGDGDLFKPTSDYSGDTSSSVKAERQPQREPQPRPVPASPALPAQSIEVEAGAEADGELVKISPMRRSIAEHMVRSKLQTSPHVTTVFEVDLSAVMAHRETNKAEFAKQGVNLTLTAYFVAASVAALRAVPLLNAEWHEGGIFIHRDQHIGMAVALDEGLIVPVIKRAGDLSLLGLARAVNDLAGRARAKALKPDDVQGGTFTITNHGVSGSLFATPIINQPQVGILGVGVVEKRVKVITDAHGSDMLAIRPCVYVTLTFDHRVVDGAAGDAFLMTVKETLESWT